MPCERWTEKEARKRPQSVGCVAGETTYLPMEMVVFEILINQDRRLESTCVSIEWLGWLQLGRPKGRPKVAECGQHRAV